ncbi:short-chain collagen C4-like [Mizuhopecten yessoensis]|uniref:short-chain collagen C4-like n=1 Tax=Mizuhopecten yessoensis TaxID=6573 RepID=UPI000B45C6B2|nr:short-chain collagen C4-like [Mizuhopecten yessoensis]
MRDKRILLSDPSYIQQELHDIQAKLQEYEQMKSEFVGLQTKSSSQAAEISTLKSQLATGNKGAVYVRWGRKDCPADNTTELVYSGYTGGSYYDSTGAASNYVCLPPDPLWGPHKNLRSYQPAYMYGTEYEDPTLFGVNDYSEDAPCAVCRTSEHSTSVMIPARTECYAGWEKAYYGSLSANDANHKAASEYVCVDEHPQALTGGSRNDNGKLFYQVRTVCGPLQCPPYEHDKVLSCVVCLK